MADYDDNRDLSMPRRTNGGRGGMKTVLVILAAVGLVGLCCIGSAVGLMFWGTSRIREAASNMKSQNNLKQMVLAMHNYDSAYGRLPKASLHSKDGKPGLSWRVALLSFIEQDSLYRQFKLDEPWDSPRNIKLLDRMPPTYALPGDPPGGNTTHYRVFAGNGAMFDHEKAISMEDVKDGPENTIALVEATDAVPWTKPDELDYNPDGPLPPLGLPQRKGILVGMADGSIHFVPRDLNPVLWHRAIQYKDGQGPGEEFLGSK